jgi:hypothetical protein
VALCTALGAAETDSITTRSGITYTNAVIQRADPDGVVIEYAPRFVCFVSRSASIAVL